MIKIGKSSEEKIGFARKLLKMGVSYRDIQANLKIKFGSGMSNTTLQNLLPEVQNEMQRDDRIQQLETELNLYKQMYFELLETIKKKMQLT
ncbi:hypothetical protein NEF87_000047 [Candidatus Lokiarchaeum ossiferum]|uniref:Transposase n=1 Tax=Candidatus Lokiarchaeum ossiferum TaxID=2951803 RepID=A0ABY6HMX9_9ARCH|nr:hypothetical protein NEF87_000047 [Candidatus Lokiarchaeum sp. B-35]